METGSTTTPTSTAGTVQRQVSLVRLAPAVGLFFLAPLVAEYLLGNVPFSMLWGIVFLAPMYGGGAVLIREVARRMGRGWPTIFFLATAYGLLEVGLLDQSLFNPSYARLAYHHVAPIPALGIGAYDAQAFILGHAIWSISVPIAITEALVPYRSKTPWLGNFGLIFTPFVFILGCWIIFDDHQRTEQFLASPPQMTGAVVGILLLIAAAFAVPHQPTTQNDKPAPQPWQVGMAAFLLLSLFILRPENWLGVAIGFVLLAALARLVVVWSQRAEWDEGHRLALAAGALLTYAWLGFLVPHLTGSADSLTLVGNVTLAVVAIALLAAAAWSVKRAAPSTRD